MTFRLCDSLALDETLTALGSAGEALAERIESFDGADWGRSGTRDGEPVTALELAHEAIHEGVHHRASSGTSSLHSASTRSRKAIDSRPQATDRGADPLAAPAGTRRSLPAIPPNNMRPITRRHERRRRKVSLHG